MSTSKPLFVDLEPPKGGLATLRNRLEQLEGRRVIVRRLVVVAASVIPLVLISLTQLRPGFTPHVEPAPLDIELTRMRLGLVPEIPEGVQVAAEERSSSAVLQMSRTDDVVIYYVGSVR